MLTISHTFIKKYDSDPYHTFIIQFLYLNSLSSIDNDL